MSEIFKDINAFTEANADAIFRDIARLVKHNSVQTAPADGAPFGEGAAACLKEALEISAELGLEPHDCEGMIGYAQVGEGGTDCEKYLATITHLDIVPTGEGWTGDPFVMREREGYILGRGVMDDKGPSVICLYALKFLKEKNISLKYPVRALLGVNEETGMADVIYYLKNYPAPLFCFSPDANFPMCNGEKGIYRGNMMSGKVLENIIDIKGGEAANAIPAKAEAWVKAEKLCPTAGVDVEETEAGVWHLTAHGIGGHASMPDGTVNAIGVLVNYILDNGIASEKELPFLEAVRKLNASTDGSSVGAFAKDDVFGELTLIGGVIGTEDGRMFQSLDSRYPLTTDGKTITAAVAEAAGSEVAVEMLRETPPFYMSLDKPEVQACLDAYNEITGENAKPYTIGGGTYARDFPNAVSFGPEHPERPQPAFAGPIHGADEGASKEFLLESLKIYILALLKLEEIEF